METVLNYILSNWLHVQHEHNNDVERHSTLGYATQRLGNVWSFNGVADLNMYNNNPSEGVLSTALFAA